jgi:hypothetical protein
MIPGFLFSNSGIYRAENVNFIVADFTKFRRTTMDENQVPTGNSTDPSTQKSSEEEIKKSVEAEILEMEKYKWNLGVQLRHDPLQDRSLNDIYCEWIDKYAADFRKFWEEKNKEDLQKIE